MEAVAALFVLAVLLGIVATVVGLMFDALGCLFQLALRGLALMLVLGAIGAAMSVCGG